MSIKLHFKEKPEETRSELRHLLYPYVVEVGLLEEIEDGQIEVGDEDLAKIEQVLKASFTDEIYSPDYKPNGCEEYVGKYLDHVLSAEDLCNGLKEEIEKRKDWRLQNEN